MQPLSLIRALTPLAWSEGFRRHLTDCAAYEMIDRRLLPWLPRLTCGHVLRLRPLPSGDRRHGILLDPAGEWVE